MAFHDRLREFGNQDDEQTSGGGGALDQARKTFEQGTQTIADGVDHGLGSTDEAIGRQFDDQEGGGVADGLKSFTGVEGLQQTETFQEASENVREADGPIEEFTARVEGGTRTGVDLLLDNPNASVQEGVQAGMTGAFNLATDGQQADDEDVARRLTGAYQGAQEDVGQAIEGTPLDNQATDTAAWLGSAVIGQPAEAVVGGLTGVDLTDESGNTEAEVGAMDLFDVGVSVATAGAGKAGIAAARSGASEGGTLLGRVLGRGGDEAASALDDAAVASDDAAGASDDVLDATPALDDAAGAGDDVVDLVPAADEGASGFQRFVTEGADDAAQVVDEAAQATDEAAGATDDAVASAIDDVAPAADEGGSFTSRVLGRGGDDAASATDDAASATDDAASVTDDAAQAGDDAAGATDEAVASAVDDVATGADEGGSLFSRVTSRLSSGADDVGSRVSDSLGGRLGTATLGTGAFLVGGAVGGGVFDSPQDAPDEIETASGHSLVGTKEYEPTDRFPQGGRLYAVSRDGQNLGYWLLLGTRGRNLIVLDDNGETRRAKISTDQFRDIAQAPQAGGSA